MRELPDRKTLDPAAPPGMVELSGGGRVVGIVAASGAHQGGSAATAAARMAAAWSAGGIRLILADGSLSEPKLHDVLGIENGEGISDALVFGSSLRRVARAVDGEDYFAVAAGTVVADPSQAMAAGRWSLLCEGFRDAGVMLAVYLNGEDPSTALALREVSHVVVVAEETEQIPAVVSDCAAPVVAVIGVEAQEPALAPADEGDAVRGPGASDEEDFDFGGLADEIAVAGTGAAGDEEALDFGELADEAAAGDGAAAAEEEALDFGGHADEMAAGDGAAAAEEEALDFGGLADEMAAGNGAAAAEEEAFDFGGPADEVAVGDAAVAADEDALDFGGLADEMAAGDAGAAGDEDAFDLGGLADEMAAEDAGAAGDEEEFDFGGLADEIASGDAGAAGEGEALDFEGPTDEIAAAGAGLASEEDVLDMGAPVGDLAAAGGGPAADEAGFNVVGIAEEIGPDGRAGGVGGPPDGPLSAGGGGEESFQAASGGAHGGEQGQKEIVLLKFDSKPTKRERRSTSPLFLVPLLVIAGAMAADWFGYVEVPGWDFGPATVDPPSVPEAAGSALPVEQAPAQRFSVALAAHGEVATAQALVDRLSASLPNVLFLVVPVEVNGRTFHRALAGPAASSAEAGALLDRIASTTGLDPTGWVIRDTPSAFQLEDTADLGAARDRVESLTAMGVPAYVFVVDYSDGSRRYRVYAGAYADEAEASTLAAYLADNDVDAGNLTDRKGRIPE